MASRTPNAGALVVGRKRCGFPTCHAILTLQIIFLTTLHPKISLTRTVFLFREMQLKGVQRCLPIISQTFSTLGRSSTSVESTVVTKIVGWCRAHASRLGKFWKIQHLQYAPTRNEINFPTQNGIIYFASYSCQA